MGRHFWNVWVGELCSVTGTQISQFALPLLAIRRLDATPWQMGLMSAASSAAILVGSLPLGALSDRRDRLSTMAQVAGLRAAVVAVLPLALYLGDLSVGLLCIVIFVNSGLGILHESALGGAIPTLVPSGHLEQANSLIEANEAAGEVAGPALASGLVQFVPAGALLVLDAVSYAAAANRNAVVSASFDRTTAETPNASDEGIWASALAGVRTLRHDKPLWTLTLAAGTSNLFTTAFFTLFVLFQVRVLEFKPVQIGFVSAMAGVGGLLGSIVASSLVRRFGTANTFLLVYALPPLLAMLSVAVRRSTHAGGWVVAVIVGLLQMSWVACVVVNIVMSSSLMQRRIPESMLGRVTSSIRFVSWGVEPIGALSAGAFASFGLTERSVCASAALLMFLALVFVGRVRPTLLEEESRGMVP